MEPLVYHDDIMISPKVEGEGGDMGSHGHVEIQIDGKPYPVDSPVLTGLQIKELAGIASADQLFQRLEPSGDTPVFNDTVVQMHSGLKFYHLPGGITAGSHHHNGHRPSAC